MSELPGRVDTLDGWKAIAAHLGRSVRSAQRWERDLQLPVHRIPTPDGGQLVYARATEIDAWRRQHDSNAELLAPLEPAPPSATPSTTEHESPVLTPPRKHGPPSWVVAFTAGNVALALWSAFVLLRGPA